MGRAGCRGLIALTSVALMGACPQDAPADPASSADPGNSADPASSVNLAGPAREAEPIRGAGPALATEPIESADPVEAASQAEPAVATVPASAADAEHRARIDGMLGNAVFLEAVTLQLARELGLEGAEKYFLEILREGEGAPRIRDIVQVMPARVEELVASGEWRPQDLKEWKWLILTAMREGHHALMPRSMELAMELEESPARWIAAGLQFRPDRPLTEFMAEGFRHADPNNRAYTAVAAAANGFPNYVASVRALLDDPHPWVRSNAVASLVVLGDPQGVQAARELLARPLEVRPAQEVSFLFEALERAAPDENALKFVRELLPGLSGVDRVAAESILVLHGGQTDTVGLCAALLEIDPMVPEIHRCVRALSTTLTGRDAEVLVQLFHRANTQTVALDLVVALAKSGYDEVEPLLRRAAFTLPWNQGLLAAGAAHRAYGEAVLFRWIQSAPDGTPPEVFRRLGWAAAAFGGGPAVQGLRERASDPELGLPADRRTAALQGAEMAGLERPLDRPR